MSNRNAYQLLALITTHKLADKAEAIFKKSRLPLQYRFTAAGTAPSEMIDMLGLGSVDKSMLLSMIPKGAAEDLMDNLKSKLKMQEVNSGIAFTIPLSGASNLIVRLLQNSGGEALTSQGKDDEPMSEMKNALVLALINRGFSGDVMEAAKSAGATGGTVLHSRSIGIEEATALLGLAAQSEKEVVMILTSAKNRLGIMEAITARCGTHSEAKGLVLSLPVESVIGV